MHRTLPVLMLLVLAAPAHAHGLLIPTDKVLPPLAMLSHQVDIRIDDQVAVTRVEQTFRNHTDRQLEATYLFPVPKGASVRKFSMWLDGREVPGELVEAGKARKIYTDIVERTQDPGLLEYLGNNLIRLRVFPVPARGDLKVMVSFTAVAPADNGLVEYTYPLRTDAKATATLEKFSVKLDVRAQHALQNIYSPTHAITVTRPTDRHALIAFEKDQAVLDRDFQLFYTAGGKDVGLTALTHRPSGAKEGHFLLLISPRAELSKEQQVPRDMVFVLDTSGSMRGQRITQARNALKYCLRQLAPRDRFAILSFATTVNKYTPALLPAGSNQIERARKWVDELEATGATAIDDALATALAMRPRDEGRPFTVVFFTDGQPTIGETNPKAILKNVAAKNTANTRIFTFGVGDDVNAALLDQLTEQTRGIASYVREAEDIEAKVSSLYAKISNPVLTDLALALPTDNVNLSEIYPPQLPDLFHGTQLVVLGRYTGHGHVAVKLTGKVGKDTKEFVYETVFAEKTGEEKNFVEDLWARRKVGYLLDQMRVNGEKKEMVEEVISLAKRYGITTPYTSYLIVPDAPVPVAAVGRAARARHGRPNVAFGPGGVSPAPVPRSLAPAGGSTSAPKKVADFLKETKAGGDKDTGPNTGLEDARRDAEKKRLTVASSAPPTKTDPSGKPTAEAPDVEEENEIKALDDTRDQLKTLEKTRNALLKARLDEVQTGKLGVDVAVQTNKLRRQSRLSPSAVRRAGERRCLEVGGVWIDEGFEAKMPTVTVKALSKAYFRILERHPGMRDVFRLGNHLVWVTPSGTALVIDTGDGLATMNDADIDRLFVVPKK